MVNQSDWLASKTNQRQVMPFKFANQLMLLDARKAVYWIAQSTLIISDLHLEKGSYLSKFANPIPHYDSRKSLEVLQSVINDYQPTCIISLGDSFHDPAAHQRMPTAEKEMLQSVVSSTKNWVWILGNHDPSLPEAVNGIQKVDWMLEGILFTHEPQPKTNMQVVGHYHPKGTVMHKRLKVRGPSLLLSERHLMMPAFGQYTGGLDFLDPVVTEVLGSRQRRGFVLAEQKIFPIK